MGQPIYVSYKLPLKSKTLDSSGIRTRIIWVEGEHADD